MKDEAYWKGAARVFDQRADEYDGWYEDSLLFEVERAALADLGADLPRPRLELGMGPGRFAAALKIPLGIDPALAPLRLASGRGIQGVRAIGEQLPLLDRSLGTLYLLFTLCFLERPPVVLAEARRVLRSDGRLVLGIVPASSPWGRMLAAKARAGHPYYRHARFHELGEIMAMLSAAGFTLVDSRSTLLQPPEAFKAMEAPRPGLDSTAGFCVLVAKPHGP